MAQTNGRDIFQLDPTEHIWDDFSCKENALLGRMYITSTFLCFYRSIMGFNKKLKLKWLEIIKIQSNGKNGILVQLREGKEKELIFSGITDRVKVVNFLLKLWRNANGVESESEVSESDQEEKKELRQRSKSGDQDLAALAEQPQESIRTSEPVTPEQTKRAGSETDQAFIKPI